MVLFKWLDLLFGVLGGFVGLAVVWIGAKHFLVGAAPLDRVPLSWQRILPIMVAVLAAHGVCAIVIHPDDQDRMLYGAVSLILIASMLMIQIATLKVARSTPAEDS
jgi:hypothetical protein